MEENKKILELTKELDNKEEKGNGVWMPMLLLLFSNLTTGNNEKINSLEKEIAELKGKISILERLV